MVGQVAGTVKALWYRESTSVVLPRSAEMPPAARAAAPAKTPAAETPANALRADAEPRYTISDLAREFAVTTRAIRFYEDEGLLQPARVGQARIYGERERVRIKLILRGKRLGLALSEIRELLDTYAQTRSERSQLEKFLVMLADRRAMLQQQREDIAAVLVEIGILERDCRRRLKMEPATPARAGGPARGG
jgi:DNA-binding transcriptional MerR regulator